MKLKYKTKILARLIILCVAALLSLILSSLKEEQLSTKNIFISNKALLDMLNNENVFLIDINKLKEIEQYRSINELEIDFYKYFEPNSILSCGCFSNQLYSLLLKVWMYLINLYLYNIDFNSYI
jgi:hypothetical protein